MSQELNGKQAIFFAKYTHVEMASHTIQTYKNKAKNLYTIYFVFDLDGGCSTGDLVQPGVVRAGMFSFVSAQSIVLFGRIRWQVSRSFYLAVEKPFSSCTRHAFSSSQASRCHTKQSSAQLEIEDLLLPRSPWLQTTWTFYKDTTSESCLSMGSHAPRLQDVSLH